MVAKSLQCDICGGPLSMDPGGKTATCKACGMEHSLERVKEKVQEIRGTVIIEGVVKASQTGTEEDIQKWKTVLHKYMGTCDYASALPVVKKILEADPSDIESNQIYDSLQELQYFDIRNGILTGYHGKSRILKIPEGITQIEQGVFSSFSSASSFIEKIEIPNSLKAVSRGAFETCVNLREIIWGDNLKMIPEGMFLNCVSLKKVHIPESVEEIGASAFEGCESLEEIIISNSVKEIGASAFRGCSIKIIDIPGNVKRIGESAFFNCKQLNRVDIQSGVEEIGAFVFHGCESLSKITLPTSVTEIGEGLFGDCLSIESVKILGEINSIPDNAFYNCVRLCEVEIPHTVTTIGKEAFGKCKSIREMRLPEGVVSIGAKAFAETNIVKLNVPNVRETAECLYRCNKVEDIQATGQFLKEYRINYKKINQHKWVMDKEYASPWQEKMDRCYTGGRCEYCGGKRSFLGYCKTCGAERRTP